MAFRKQRASGLPFQVPGSLLLWGFLAGSIVSVPAAAAPVFQVDDRVGEEERAEIDRMRRRGENGEALEVLDELLEDFPDDFLIKALRGRSRFEACDYAGALADAEEALEAARATPDLPAEEGALCARIHAEILVELGRASEALEVLEGAEAWIRSGADARDAWILGRAHAEAGDRPAARAAFEAGAESPGPRRWQVLWAQARCQRALGRIEQAASTLVAAEQLAKEDEGIEPDILVALGDLYFEAYGEVADAVSLAHSPAELYREAQTLHPDHEGARLGFFELYRFNWRRSRSSPQQELDALLAARPLSIPGLLAQASAALDDGELQRARKALAQLDELAPARRDVRTEKAALAWIEHRREECDSILEELLGLDAQDSAPEREVGRHLLELYRFAEALPFLTRAVERDPLDWRAWKELGRAQANTGDEESARKSLTRAVEVAEGRRDAWRDNTLLVLKRMAESMVEHETEALRFAWLPDAAFVLRTYLEPFYADAREELAQRYGFTPDEVKIEVFRQWEDFSVRSTGFQGYPALGVCFGPVVTAVSPLSEMRGNFSWARTSYHEFTHVIHLGLSHNRCPRWITEGLATWEEGVANPAWWRNMRRDLVDAHANGTIFPVRRLNNAFRGPRVLFAYYQGGLLCKMLIEAHGFSPMVRLLEAFDRGADLDQAFEEVFARTPEEIDADFQAFVQREIAELSIEPRWSPQNAFERRFRLARTRPEDPEERKAWGEEWCKVAWGYHWGGQRLDAEEALRLAETAGDLPARGLFLRGELFVAKGDLPAATGAFQRGFELGGEDFRARMALAALLMRAYEVSTIPADREQLLDRAEHHFLAAERAFPGYDQSAFSAELRLASLYEIRADEDRANEARMRWLGYNSGSYEVRVSVAEWLYEKERFEESERYWREANEVDPFRRHLHLRWGLALRALGRNEEALREFEVGLAVPYELDGDVLIGEAMQAMAGIPPVDPDPADDVEQLFPDDGEGADDDDLLARWNAEEPLLWGHRALTLLELGRAEEARAAVEEALALDPDCEPALEAQTRVP